MSTDVLWLGRFSLREKGALFAGTVLAGLATWAILRPPRSRTSRELGPVDCAGAGGAEGELAGFRYLERVTGGADPSSALPMVVLFHSRGSRPENHAGMLRNLGRPVRLILPEGPERLGSARSWTTRPSRTPDQDAWADELEALGEDLADFLDAVVACRPTLGRPIVTGSSEGGHMAYLVASQLPDRVRGAVAVAGYLPVPLWSAAMAPTVGLHGEEDTAVPFARTQTYWSAMEAEGAPIRTRSFPGVGHGVPSQVSQAWTQALRTMLST